MVSEDDIHDSNGLGLPGIDQIKINEEKSWK